MKIKLGDICKFQSGGTPSRANVEYFNGNIPWITTAVLSGGIIDKESAVEWITNKAINDSAAKIVPANSIMVGTRVGVGKVAINAIDMSTNQDIISLINIDETKWNKEYLCKFIQGKSIYLNSQARGATIKGIKIDVLSGLELPEISIEEQYRVSRILDTVKKILDSRNIELQKLDNLVNARFVEMFGDENNSKKWDIVNVEEVADVQVGVVIKPSQYYTKEKNGIRAFRSLNIGEGSIKDSDWVYFTEEGHQKNSKSILKENDLLIVRSGAPGTACVVTKEYEGCNAIDIIIAHPDCEKVNPYYLCSFTNMPHGKKQIDEGTGGAAQQHFNVGKYNKLQLMLPPKKLQDEFVEFIHQVAKSKVTETLELITTLYMTLIHPNYKLREAST